MDAHGTTMDSQVDPIVPPPGWSHLQENSSEEDGTEEREATGSDRVRKEAATEPTPEDNDSSQTAGDHEDREACNHCLKTYQRGSCPQTR